MLEEWIREKSKEGGANSWLRSKPVQYLVLILVCLGLLALIWPTGSEQKLAERPGTGLESLDPTQGSKQISQEVASILAKIEGAGKDGRHNNQGEYYYVDSIGKGGGGGHQ
jgi:stage III sporulation protein AG